MRGVRTQYGGSTKTVRGQYEGCTETVRREYGHCTAIVRIVLGMTRERPRHRHGAGMKGVWNSFETGIVGIHG